MPDGALKPGKGPKDEPVAGQRIAPKQDKPKPKKTKDDKQK